MNELRQYATTCEEDAKRIMLQHKEFPADLGYPPLEGVKEENQS